MFSCSSIIALTISYLSITYYKIIQTSILSNPDIVLKYRITNSKRMKIFLNTPSNSKNLKEYCYMKAFDMFSGEVTDTFFCSDENGKNHDCNMSCASFNTYAEFDGFNPRTSFLSISIGKPKSDAGEADLGENIYGFEIPPIINPSFTLKFKTWKLMIKMSACEDISCPIKYDGILLYNISEPKNKLDKNFEDIYMNFMIPYYIVECPNYPPQFFNTLSEAIQDLIEANKPQYNIYYESSEEGQRFYHIHFTSSNSDDICYFGYRNASLNRVSDNFLSNCHKANSDKKCYAPCKDVKLFDELPDLFVIEIIIKTRHQLLIDENDYNINLKIIQHRIAWRRNSSTDLIVSNQGDHFLCNKTMIRLTSDLIYVQEYLTDVYSPYEFKTTMKSKIMVQCYKSEAIDQNDYIGCDNKVEQFRIYDLPKGTPIILKITIFDIPNHSKYINEPFYIMLDSIPPKAFGRHSFQVTDSSIIIQAVSNAITNLDKNSPTCIYLISPTLKNSFREAHCENHNFCRGFCDKRKIIYLDNATLYDVKVTAKNEYGSYIYTSDGIDFTAVIERNRNRNTITVSVKYVPIYLKCQWILFTSDTSSDKHYVKKCLSDDIGQDDCDNSFECAKFIITKVDADISYFLKIIVVDGYGIEIKHKVFPVTTIEVTKSELTPTEVTTIQVTTTQVTNSTLTIVATTTEGIDTENTTRSLLSSESSSTSKNTIIIALAVFVGIFSFILSLIWFSFCLLWEKRLISYL